MRIRTCNTLDICCGSKWNLSHSGLNCQFFIYWTRKGSSVVIENWSNYHRKGVELVPHVESSVWKCKQKLRPIQSKNSILLKVIPSHEIKTGHVKSYKEPNCAMTNLLFGYRLCWIINHHDESMDWMEKHLIQLFASLHAIKFWRIKRL